MSSAETRRKTIKLVVSPQYRSTGYQDYTAIHDISDKVSVLKDAALANNRNDGTPNAEMTLLFRGRKITPEEESFSFEALMEKVRVFPL
jgi:hypothetical protein